MGDTWSSGIKTCSGIRIRVLFCFRIRISCFGEGATCAGVGGYPIRRGTEERNEAVARQRRPRTFHRSIFGATTRRALILHVEAHQPTTVSSTRHLESLPLPFPSLFLHTPSYVLSTKSTMITYPRRTLWSCIAVLALLNVVFCADIPLVDFDRMGTVGLVGTFAGLNFVNSSSANVSFDRSTSTLPSRSADGSLNRIASTNAGGVVSAGCALGNTYYLAGNFSSIGNATASNVASYNPASGTFSALGKGGPNGPVSALYCDSNRNKLWAGGQFSSPASAVA